MNFCGIWVKYIVLMKTFTDGKCWLLLYINHNAVSSTSVILNMKAWDWYKLDMSTARRRRKSPQSLSGTSAHPTMVTLVNIMVLNGWLTSFSFHVNQAPHSWDKAISDSDLETLKVKVMGVVKIYLLSEPMLKYCQLDPWEQNSVKSWSKFIHFHSRKCIWKCCLENGSHFVSASMC